MLQIKEQDQLAAAIRQSKEEMRQRAEQDISKKLLLKEPWQVIRDDVNQTLTVFTLKNTDVLGPQVQSGKKIKEDMSLNVYKNSVKLNRIGNKLLPLKAERISTIEKFAKTSVTSTELVFKFLKSFFVVQNFNIALNKVDFFGAISFS